MDTDFLDNLPLIASVVVTLIVLLLFRKRFYLAVVRLFYGRFSLHYVNAYRRLFYNHPFPQSIKDDFINHIIVFFQTDNKITEYQTSEKIEFLGFNFGSTLKQLLKAKKNPDSFYVTKENTHEVKILGFNENLFGGDVKALFYFIDDRFFMGEYIFTEISKVNPSLLSKAISEKYKLSESVEGQDFLINSSGEYKLYYTNTGFSIMIRYFSLKDPIVAKKLKESVKSFIDIFSKSNDSEAVNTLIKYL